MQLHCDGASPSFESRFMKGVSLLKLSEPEMAFIRNRYIRIITSAETEYKCTTGLFLFLTNFITIGGILLIALLALGKITAIPDTVIEVFYWVSWVFSVLITIANKTLYSFNIPKKYILNVLVLEKYKSEGWQFIGGLGKYEPCKIMHDRVQLFNTRIERIKIKSLEIMANLEIASMEKMQEGARAANTQVGEDAKYQTVLSDIETE